MWDAFPQSPAIAAAYQRIGPDQPGQPGDTAIWGALPGIYPSTHVANVLRDAGGLLLCLSQNSSPARPDLPGYSTASTGPAIIQHLTKKGLLGYLRPRVNTLNTQGTTEPGDDLLSTKEERQQFIAELMTHPVRQTDGTITNLEQSIAERRPHVLQTLAAIGGIPAATLNQEIPRGGGAFPGNTTLAGMVAWNDQHVIDQLAATAASAAADGSTADEIAEAVKRKIADGITVKVEVSAEGGK